MSLEIQGGGDIDVKRVMSLGKKTAKAAYDSTKFAAKGTGWGLGWGTRRLLVPAAKGIGKGSVILGKQGAKMGAQTYDYWKNQTAKLRGQRDGQPFKKRNYVARNVREGCIDVRTFGGKYRRLAKPDSVPGKSSMRHQRRIFNRNRTQRKPNVRS